MTTTLPKRDSMDAINTKLQTTSLAPTRSPPSLITLPHRILSKISTYLLDIEHANSILTTTVSYTATLSKPSGLLNFSASRSPFPVTTSVFYTSRPLSSAALHFFYSRNLFIRLTLYTDDARHAKALLLDSGILFSAAAPEAVERCMRHAMDLTIAEKGSTQKRAVVMFPAQYLPRLVNYLEKASAASSSWAPNHALSMHVRNAYDFPVSRLQGDLLEGFRVLSGFGNVTIDEANVLPVYAAALKASLMAPQAYTAQGFLGCVTGLTERAEGAFASGDWNEAVEHAQAAIMALTYGYLTRAEVLHSAPEDTMKGVQRVRWRCEMIIAKGLYALHGGRIEDGKWLASTLAAGDKSKMAKDTLAAETAASQALSVANDSPNPDSNPWFQTLPAELIPPNKKSWFTDEERAASWYVCGLVHTALSEYLFAAGDLERACGLHPEGQGFAKAFEKAREAIDWNVKPGTGMKKAVVLVTA